jgi:hypothetical protein
MNEFDVNRRERLLPSTNPERPTNGIMHFKSFPAGDSFIKTFANDTFGANTKYCKIQLTSASVGDFFVHFTMDGTEPKPGPNMSGYPAQIGHRMNKNTFYYFDLDTVKKLKFRNIPNALSSRLILMEMTQ